MKRPTIAAAIILASITAAHAQQSRVVSSPNVGPWEMLSTGTGATGTPGVFVLNTQTGEVQLCLVTPGGGAGNGGCAPMPSRKLAGPNDPIR